MTDRPADQPGPIETTATTDPAAIAALKTGHLAGTLPVLGWLEGHGRTPNSGKTIRLPVAVVDLSSRPDVADLARVCLAEEAGDPRWTGHVVTGWTALLDRHGAEVSAPLVCDVQVTRPVACAFRLRIDYLRDKDEVRHLERSGWIGLVDSRLVADVPDDATLDTILRRNAFSWRFKAATLRQGMLEIDELLREIGR